MDDRRRGSVRARTAVGAWKQIFFIPNCGVETNAEADRDRREGKIGLCRPHELALFTCGTQVYMWLISLINLLSKWSKVAKTSIHIPENRLT